MTYLDYNATTPVDPKVLEAMLPLFSEKFGNPSSSTHPKGWEAEAAIAEAREATAQFIGAQPEEITFSAGATEGIKWIFSQLEIAHSGKNAHIITVETEHKATLDACQKLEAQGFSVTYLPVSQEGLISMESLEGALTENTVLISIMYANNETGVIQPVIQIAELAKKHGCIFMTDATQAIGKLTVKVYEKGIDIMPFSAHKFYGPKGIGGLFVRKEVYKKHPLLKPKKADAMNGGTPNVPGIVGLGKACAVAMENLPMEALRLVGLRDYMEHVLMGLDGVLVNGNYQQRLPNTANLSFEGIESTMLIEAINREICVSAGSACNTANPEPSHVLVAMGFSPERIAGSVRFSLGRFTTKQEVERALAKIENVVRKLR